MLALAGITDPARAAVYELEVSIAQAHWPAAERRDADKTYNVMSSEELTALAPQFPWSAYFTAAGIPAQSPAGARRIDIAENSAFPKLAALFAATPVPVWRDYLTVRAGTRPSPRCGRAMPTICLRRSAWRSGRSGVRAYAGTSAAWARAISARL
jgi:putative endopeptidase